VHRRSKKKLRRSSGVAGDWGPVNGPVHEATMRPWFYTTTNGKPRDEKGRRSRGKSVSASGTALGVFSTRKRERSLYKARIMSQSRGKKKEFAVIRYEGSPLWVRCRTEEEGFNKKKRRTGSKFTRLTVGHWLRRKRRGVKHLQKER